MLNQPVTAEELRAYREDGFFFLRDFIPRTMLAELSQRIDDLMDGKIRRDGMSFEKDVSPAEQKLAVRPTSSFSGPSRDYRKIKGFEYDDLFLRLFQCAKLRTTCEALIGPHVSCMRAMLFNKPALHGAELPFHQDVHAKWPMTASPELTVWIAFDDATVANGCMEFAVGSHKHGRIGEGHFLDLKDEPQYAPPDKRRMIEVKAGEAVVFHCALLHRSGANHSPLPRRAMTLCLMDGAIRHTRLNRTYPIIFGDDALRPDVVARMGHAELMGT